MARVVKCIKPAAGLEVGKLYEVSCDAYDLIHVGGEHDGHSRDCFEYVRAVKVDDCWLEVLSILSERSLLAQQNGSLAQFYIPVGEFILSELPTETPTPHPLTKYARKSTMGESPRVILQGDKFLQFGCVSRPIIPTDGNKATVDGNGDVEYRNGLKTVSRTTSDQIGGTHYAKNDPIQFARDNYPKEQLEGFFRINVDKYVARYDKKNGVEDLKKARHYLDMLIDLKEVK